MCPQSSQRSHVPGAMSLSELANACMAEIKIFSRSEPNSEQYCLELFHRALVQHDPDAWELLQERCNPMVRAWIYKHPHHAIACYHEPIEYYAAHTFTRVWQSSMLNTLEFDTLSGALSYLKLSLQGVVIDALRMYSRPNCAQLPISGSGPDTYSIEESGVENNHGRGEVWDNINALLLNKRERRLAYLFYHCNLKPKEIARNYPEHFSDTQEIYGLIRNIMERLMCNRDQSCWRLLYDQ
jgi:hypothetical protein